jgi:hypothetical protein
MNIPWLASAESQLLFVDDEVYHLIFDPETSLDRPASQRMTLRPAR